MNTLGAAMNAIAARTRTGNNGSAANSMGRCFIEESSHVPRLPLSLAYCLCHGFEAQARVSTLGEFATSAGCRPMPINLFTPPIIPFG